VVEKSLKKQGAIKHRDDLGRKKLVEKIWEWKEKHAASSSITQEAGCSATGRA